MTLLIALWPEHGYFWCCMNSRADHLSHQHIWIMAMLLGLITFNEPLMAVRVNSSLLSDPLSKLNVLVSTVYVSLLMYYWLVLLDDCRVSSASGWQTMTFKQKFDLTDKKLLIFYAPKIVLIIIIWSLTFASYCTYAAMAEKDPSFHVVDGTMADSTYKNLAIAIAFFMAVYMLWTFILFLMVVVKSCALPVPYKWLFGLSSFTLLMVIIGMYLGIAYPVPSTPFIFVGFYGVINAYVWVMALAWAPLEIEGGVLGYDAEMEMGMTQGMRSSTDTIESETDTPFQHVPSGEGGGSAPQGDPMAASTPDEIASSS
jgi:hypothetical protein